MVKKLFAFAFLAIFVFSLTGCATTSKQKDLEIQALKNQITVLQTQIQSKDTEIGSLEDTLGKSEEGKVLSGGKKAICEAKSRPKTKEIQTALKNAGYDPGFIDGKMGKKTCEAIKAFQKANNLVVDGKVGKQTWDLLKTYLEKKQQ
jgi:peptidoglycan hydrolase-like protein with peptidoglycan-binding domain